MIDNAQIESLLEYSRVKLSDIQPADWSEAHRVMSSAESKWEGKFNYSLTPYWREVINRFGPDDPALIIGVKKGAQTGCSKGVLENIICYRISEHPCNI